MATQKEEALQAISKMPDDATLAEIVETLMFRAKVSQGIAQAEAGELVDHNEVEENFRRWRGSVGQR